MRPTNFELRGVTLKDIPILYKVTQAGMSQINQASNPNLSFSEEQKAKHYQEYILEFGPQLSNIQLITVGGENV